MCPAIAYMKDGVVVKLEGDPEAPVSRGSLCIKGLNQLHTMYASADTLTKLRRVKLVFDIEFPLLLRCLLCLSVYL